MQVKSRGLLVAALVALAWGSAFAGSAAPSSSAPRADGSGAGQGAQSAVVVQVPRASSAKVGDGVSRAMIAGPGGAPIVLPRSSDVLSPCIGTVISRGGMFFHYQGGYWVACKR